MCGEKLIILQELFPHHDKKIFSLMETNPDLQIIIEDLLECHQVWANESAAHFDTSVSREYWEELFSDIRNEAITLINRGIADPRRVAK